MQEKKLMIKAKQKTKKKPHNNRKRSASHTPKAEWEKFSLCNSYMKF